jgi:hypothetical protein
MCSERDLACRYWQLQLPMFIVAVCAAVTGLAAASCYLYIFAYDMADDVFIKGLKTSEGTSPPVFVALLVIQPLEFFSCDTQASRPTLHLCFTLSLPSFAVAQVRWQHGDATAAHGGPLLQSPHLWTPHPHCEAPSLVSRS